ncbi:MAG: beta-lactamase family protein [Deltaproteobacteria bacterium]|nr:beta-lactamase family protein [Deltaproteobacteria bacterium]
MNPVRKIIKKHLKTIEVPADLDSVTTIGKGEADPVDTGMTEIDISAIWESVEDLYKTGVYPGISLCLRRHGRLAINRAIGHSHGNGPLDPPDSRKTLMTTDTPVCQFSASKAITAMVIHLLAERDIIDLNTPVAFYIPEFAANGKQKVTVYDLVSHHGGVPLVPKKSDPEILFDPQAFAQLVCSLKPASAGGKTRAYHAITGGAVLGELVQRVTGRSIRRFLAEEIQKPLGFRYFSYGVKDADIASVATNYDTGPPLVFPFSTLAARALGASWGEVVRVSNEPRFLKTIIPAANLVATADEMSRFFQMMLNGGILDGVRIFSPKTIDTAINPYGKMGIDRTMIIPMRYSAGLMLGADPMGMWGPFSDKAFGHVGFIHILCWADPSRDISVSLQTTGKSLVGSHVSKLVRFLMATGRHCRIEDSALANTQKRFSAPLLVEKAFRNLLL